MAGTGRNEQKARSQGRNPSSISKPKIVVNKQLLAASEVAVKQPASSCTGQTAAHVTVPSYTLTYQSSTLFHQFQAGLPAGMFEKYAILTSAFTNYPSRKCHEVWVSRFLGCKEVRSCRHTMIGELRGWRNVCLNSTEQDSLTTTTTNKSSVLGDRTLTDGHDIPNYTELACCSSSSQQLTHWRWRFSILRTEYVELRVDSFLFCLTAVCRVSLSRFCKTLLCIRAVFVV